MQRPVQYLNPKRRTPNPERWTSLNSGEVPSRACGEWLLGTALGHGTRNGVGSYGGGPLP